MGGRRPPCTGLRSSPIRPAKLVPLQRSWSIEMRSISIVSTKRSFVLGKQSGALLEQRSCSEASPLSLGRKKEAYKKERVSFFLTTLLRRVQCCSTALLALDDFLACIRCSIPYYVGLGGLAWLTNHLGAEQAQLSTIT